MACVEPAWLLATSALGGVRSPSDADAWLHHGPRASSFRTHTVSVADPAQIAVVHLWLRLVTQLDGPRLLRIKALVECADTGDLYVLQSAEHAVSPPRRLAHRPPGVRGAQVVIIDRGLPDDMPGPLIESLRKALAGTLRA